MQAMVAGEGTEEEEKKEKAKVIFEYLITNALKRRKNAERKASIWKKRRLPHKRSI